MWIDQFLKKAKTILITLRFSILFIFVTLFILAVGTLLAITYLNSAKGMTYVSHQFIDKISSSVFQNITNEFQRIKIENELAAEMMRKGVLDQNNDTQIADFIFSMMDSELKTLSSVQSVFWANEKGSVILSGKDIDGSIFTQNVNRDQLPPSLIIIKRDLQNNIISVTKSPNPPYDHRVRFWYIATKQSGKTQMTDVYQYKYFGPPYWGITISTPTYDKSGNFIGTFGINVRIDFLRHLIENITISPNGRIFIVTDDGQIVAYPKASQYLSPQLLNIHNFSNGAVSKSFDIYSATKNTLFSFNLDGENYLATYKPLPGFGGHTWYLGIVVPTQDFIGTLMRANFITMGLGLLILILGILLVSEIISRIVKPLRSLANETRKIKHFELSGDTKVHSRIKEVVYLADSLQDMKKGLRLFQKYVPASLVRQLIEAGEDAQVGGSKRQLVTLFTDIEHFTTISERLDPHQLMTYMCKYLDELSKIILEERGTIDKYIGDSIMAFWGAPLPEEEPCQQAARSALRCQKRLHELNTQWEKQAIPAFKTRIGIHMGEAIVGNLGSSERFNYTAIGDSINTASRLEGANKIYQTQIVVSETVYQQIKNQFYVRLLDFVSLLGRDEPLYIYELMAEKNETLSFDFDQYVRTFSKAFAHYQQQQWDEAIVSFDQCVKIYPSDQLASIYIARCKEFKINPPSSEWHGAWTIRGK